MTSSKTVAQVREDEQNQQVPKPKAAAKPAASVFEEQTYTVQQQETLPDSESGQERWRDVATVTVPARTHRKTIIKKALEQANVAPTPGSSLRLRVLDADSARVETVGAVQPPPQLTFGGDA